MEESKALQVIEEINGNKELLDKINNAKSAEDIINAMSAAGYQVTPENAQAAFEKVQSGVELDEDALDNVPGGSILGTLLVYSVATYAGCIAAGIGGALFSMSTSKSTSKKKKKR